MKKSLILILVLLLLVMPNALAIKSWSFVLVPSCKVCVEGARTNVSLQLKNNGDEELSLKGLSLKDASDIVFFQSPMESKMSSGESVTIKFNMVLPPASRGSTLFYKPCILLEDQIMCSNNFARMIIMPYESIECISDNDCSSNHICSGYKCRIKPGKEWNTNLIIGIVLGVLVIAVIIIALTRKRY